MTIGLIGYRGSGKSTVGRLLAERLGMRFVDVDAQIVGRAGKNIKQIFEELGEQAFRDLETEAVRELCTLHFAVVSFGGGAMDREVNRKLLIAAGLQLIYLRCEPTELLRRIQGDPLTAVTRPNLTKFAGGIDEIEAVLARREPIWRSLATAEVDVTAIAAAEVVERCVKSWP
jgi:shikimate kinase